MIMARSEAMQKVVDKFTMDNFGTKQGQGVCVTCRSDKIKPENFRNDLSRKEFGISGMCQECQDNVFGKD
jgi:hypothetical protein